MLVLGAPEVAFAQHQEIALAPRFVANGTLIKWLVLRVFCTIRWVVLCDFVTYWLFCGQKNCPGCFFLNFCFGFFCGCCSAMNGLLWRIGGTVRSLADWFGYVHVVKAWAGRSLGPWEQLESVHCINPGLIAPGVWTPRLQNMQDIGANVNESPSLLEPTREAL